MLPRRLLRVNGVTVGCAMTVLFCLAFLFTRDFHLPKLLELKSYDMRFRLRGSIKPSGKVVIASIDDATIKLIGKWPLPRLTYAELIVWLSEAGAEAIAIDMLFVEPERNPQLETLEEMRKRFVELGLLRSDDASREYLDDIKRAVEEADSDAAFAGVVKESRRTVLAAALLPETIEHGEGEDCLLKAAYASGADDEGREAEMLPALASYHSSLVPIPALGKASPCIGIVNATPDIDGVLRRAHIVLSYKGRCYAPLGVGAVRQALKLKPEEVRVYPGGHVRVGPYTVPVDSEGMAFINYYGPVNTIPGYSVADIFNGKVDPKLFKGKIVLIGAMALGHGDIWANPFGSAMWGVEKQATVVENILDQDFITRPRWAPAADIALLLLMGLSLSFVLPRMKLSWSIPYAFFALVLFCMLNQYVFVSHRVRLSFIYPVAEVGAVYVAILVFRYLTEERQRKQIKKAFQQYISPTLVEKIVENPTMLKLGGEKKTLTVLFSDVRDFTGLSEAMTPEELVRLLNEYFDVMTEVVIENGGTLDKYIGDAMMVFFGAPVDQDDHAVRACRTALAMVDALATLHEKWSKEGGPLIEIGVGINTGAGVVGNMGSNRRFDYTVMGDTVNLSSRLEGQTKRYGVGIIVGENTYKEAGDFFHFRLLDIIRVKGKTEPVRIYELLCEKGAGAEAPSCVVLAEEASQAYRMREWQRAIEACEKVLQSSPDDGPAKLLIERCRELMECPPPEGWDGVTVRKEK